MSTVSLWTRRDPFAEFDALVRRAFIPAAATRTATRSTGFTPAAEVTRDGQDAVVRVELPGLDPANDVTIEVDRHQLVVRGQRRDDRTEEQGGRSLREVRYGSFQRSFSLPEHVTADAVSASYDAGVLNVRVAGAYASTEATRIAITTNTETAPAVEADTEQPTEQATA
jgi:HSP20 family molecular chaperone IbpA